MKVEAHFDDRNTAREAIHTLLNASYTLRDIDLVHETTRAPVRVRRRHPVIGYAVGGLLTGAAAGLGFLVVAGVFAPELSRAIVLGWGALAGVLVGAITGFIYGRLEVVFPVRSRAVASEGYEMRLDLPPRRAEHARRLLLETGAQVSAAA